MIQHGFVGLDLRGIVPSSSAMQLFRPSLFFAGLLSSAGLLAPCVHDLFHTYLTFDQQCLPSTQHTFEGAPRVLFEANLRHLRIPCETSGT
jgi:hypothetical protein